MKKLVIAALCCATAAVPAYAQAGHVHSAVCNHQFTEDQGTLKVGGLNATKGSTSGGGGLKFILNNLGGVEEDTDAFRGFQAAAAIWSNVIKDDITIRLDVRFATLGPNILGSTGSTTNTIDYAGLRGLLAADQKGFFDQMAVNSLQAGPLSFVSNEPLDAGPIDARTRFLDNNGTFDNLNININTAQVKALGLNPVYAGSNPGGRDGSVSFSSDFTWDFDRSDGLDPTKFDFVGVAAHEIGHALGFRSGVDTADVNAMPFIAPPGRRGLNNIAWGTVNDLFRYGEFGGDRVLDWSIGGRSCLSLNGGEDCVGLLSTGRRNGDGRQASHWKDDTLTGFTLGLMDPTASGPNGTRPFQDITRYDLIAFDVMGYDIAAVPEPATWAMMIGGFGFVGAAMRRRRLVRVSFA